MSIRDAILAADDRPYKDVEVEEWGVTVRVRGLSATAQEAFVRQHGTAGNADEIPQGILVDLVARTLEDPETNELIFDSADGRNELSGKSAQVITRLFKVAQPLSGLGDLDEAKND